MAVCTIEESGELHLEICWKDMQDNFIGGAKIIKQMFEPTHHLSDVKKQIDSSNVSISHGIVNAVLRKFQSNLDSARRFFQWVSENHLGKLSSRSYNAVLGILGDK
ncbi:hypothetical protein RYX36_007755 [Vicia faba]